MSRARATRNPGRGKLAIVVAAIAAVLWMPARLERAASVSAEDAADTDARRAVVPFDVAAAKSHQAGWARRLGQPVEVGNSLEMTLVLIPAGEFDMGTGPEQVDQALKWFDAVPRKAPGEDARIRDEETPRHRVVLSRPFRIARTETTIGQFRRFVAATGYVTETERFGGGNSNKTNETDPKKKDAIWRSPGYAVTDDCPVTQITWNDMVAFCNWLSESEKRAACYRKDEEKRWQRVADADGYRLPTEAEWEFACRAGTATHWSFGDELRDLDEHAWYNRTAEMKGRIGARPVATKEPNAFGLFDMHGNVWERCDDFFDPEYYRKSPVRDPHGAPAGAHRIVRGGGWHYFDLHTRSAYRNHYAPIARTANTGFRVVRAP